MRRQRLPIFMRKKPPYAELHKWWFPIMIYVNVNRGNWPIFFNIYGTAKKLVGFFMYKNLLNFFVFMV